MSFQSLSCNVYKISENKLPNIKYHIFISKQATAELATYIKQEFWGKNNSRLYNYLDYMWRLQLIGNNVKIFNYKNNYRIVFNTGLYSRNDNKLVYLVLQPNNQYCNSFNCVSDQSWRVACNKGNGKNRSFVCRDELEYGYGMKSCDIPKKTKFDECKFDSEYTFVINFKKGIYSRVIKSLQNQGYYKNIRDGLNHKTFKPMIKAGILNTINYIRAKPSETAQQIYINNETNSYHKEILLPITVNINNYDIHLSLVCRVNKVLKLYEIINIIPREMAYINARLVSSHHVSWLKPFKYGNALSSHSIQRTNTLPKTTDNQTHNIKDNIMAYDTLSLDYIYNPLMYIATILPLQLPKFNDTKVVQNNNKINNNNESLLLKDISGSSALSSWSSISTVQSI